MLSHTDNQEARQSIKNSLGRGRWRLCYLCVFFLIYANIDRTHALRMGIWIWRKSLREVFVRCWSFFFFYSGNLAKVNRMSTAHMQGEHLIKGTHTRRKKHTERSCCGEVLPGRSCWLSETRAIRDLGQALNSRANLHDFTVLLYCLDFHHRKNRNSESFSKSYIYISTTYTYTRVDQIRLGQTDD